MNEIEVRQVMDDLFAAWPRVAAPSPRVRKAWAPSLQDVSVRDANTAILRLTESNQYLPSLSEFLAMVRSVRLDRGVARAVETPIKDYSGNIGVRAPCDDELDDDRLTAAVKERGSMAGREQAPLPEVVGYVGMTFSEFLALNPEYRKRVENLQLRKSGAFQEKSVGVAGLEAILLGELQGWRKPS